MQGERTALGSAGTARSWSPGLSALLGSAEQVGILLVSYRQLDAGEPPPIRRSDGRVVIKADDKPAVRSVARDFFGQPMFSTNVRMYQRAVSIDRDLVVRHRMMRRRPWREGFLESRHHGGPWLLRCGVA